MEQKDKINFDLDFLEKNTKEKPKEQPKSKDPNWVYHKDGSGAKGPTKNPTPPSDGMSDNAKKWAWGIGIVLLFVIIGAFSDSGSSSTPTTSSNSASSGTVDRDGFTCSQYASDEADRLDADLSGAKRQALQARQNALSARSDAIDSEKSRLDAEYVDENDQDAIDSYNDEVHAYNARLQQYKTDASTLSDDIDAYNAAAAPHDNYLTQHCTKD